ncbi:MAG: topoisomerase DNA-binding C4 zinc finger domain-containing protein [Novosphingobium sp.]
MNHCAVSGGGNDQLRHLQEAVASARQDLELLNIAIPARRSMPLQTPARPVVQKPSPRTTPIAPAIPSKPSTSAAHTCPNCGYRMVRRTARKGHNVGGQFWGCSRYPYCKGTRSI